MERGKIIMANAMQEQDTGVDHDSMASPSNNTTNMGCDDIEETVQEIAKNPLEHNYPTPTVMATPTQQPVVQKE